MNGAEDLNINTIKIKKTDAIKILNTSITNKKKADKANNLGIANTI